MIKENMVEVAPQMFNKLVKFIPDEIVGKKAYRADAVTGLTVTVGSDEFDADEESMDRLDRVVSIAGWKFNQALAQGLTAADAYAVVYFGSTVPWKRSDNTWGSFPIDTLCKVQEAALNALNTVWQEHD